MTYVVFGANGKVGSIVVQKLLEKNLQVLACIYGNDTFETHENLTTLQCNIYDIESVETAVKQADIIVSTLGSWGTPNKDILTKGMENIIPAMQKYGKNRIITLTGADARATGDKLSLIHRFSRRLLLIVSRKVLKDGENHIALLKNSGLQWTTLRSPVMNEKGATKYMLTDKRPLPWQTIHRHAVADAIIDQLQDSTYMQQSPYIIR